MPIFKSFSFVLFLVFALMLTFLHEKKSVIANALLRIFSTEFHFIYGLYLILLVYLGESLWGLIFLHCS